MSDIALLVNNRILEGVPIDAFVANADLVAEDGMRTAVIISLFTDKRVTPDELPIEEQSVRGWWGDQFPDVEADQIGSRLWLLAREKRTIETLNRAVEYAEEALEWMLADGLAESVEADAEYNEFGFMLLTILIQKPNEDALSFRFKVKWDTEANRS